VPSDVTEAFTDPVVACRLASVTAGNAGFLIFHKNTGSSAHLHFSQAERLLISAVRTVPLNNVLKCIWCMSKADFRSSVSRPRVRHLEEISCLLTYSMVQSPS